ncbi:GH13005 [Drosophila grimshawi]|uniref:GH13005 n=1 Tax=Drosophila grimshawi TaxID=7222 RepID=B4JP54_DROGR|nr:GH13005 [Drosophila grimshawi]
MNRVRLVTAAVSGGPWHFKVTTTLAGSDCDCDVDNSLSLLGCKCSLTAKAVNEFDNGAVDGTTTAHN